MYDIVINGTVGLTACDLQKNIYQRNKPAAHTVFIHVVSFYKHDQIMTPLILVMKYYIKENKAWA